MKKLKTDKQIREKALEELAIMAKGLGFDYVDIYVPNMETGEVQAITFSKSEKYAKKVQDIELP